MKTSWINMLDNQTNLLVRVGAGRPSKAKVVATDTSLTIYEGRWFFNLPWNDIAKLTLSANPFPYKEALPTLTIELKS